FLFGCFLSAAAATTAARGRRAYRSRSFVFHRLVSTTADLSANRFFLFFVVVFFRGAATVATDVAVFFVHLVLMSCSEGLIVKAHCFLQKLRPLATQQTRKQNRRGLYQAIRIACQHPAHSVCNAPQE